MNLDNMYGPLINGVFELEGDTILPVTSPSTGTILTNLVYCSEDDVNRAVLAAEAALPAWKSLEQEARSHMILQLADALEDNLERMAAVDAHDVGRCISEIRHDYRLAIKCYRYFAAVIKGYEFSGRGMTDGFSLMKREPLGVCGQIIPWNAPAIMASFKLAAPLVTGNTVVLKADENASLSTLELGKMITKIFPPGVVNIITGLGDVAGAALTRNKKVRKLSFTGSTQVGKLVAKAGAERLIPVSLELGGKSPNIVFPDINDIDAVVDNVTFAAIHNNGQSCLAGTRLFVHSDIYDIFCEKLVAAFERVTLGSPLDEKSRVSCLISEKQGKRVLSYIKSGLEEGAILLTGGKRRLIEGCENGYFIEPTILSANNTMRICREEIFGPVLSLIKWTDYEMMIAEANDNEYGLASGIYTSSLKNAIDTSERLEAGSVWINHYSNMAEGLAFGGYKNSGLGREFCKTTLDAYTQIKTVTFQTELPKLWVQ
ncbi:aldehyde dehydrogenase [Enterobacter ludwigii]|nr:aldehyde dehydrogenase [Enterobacter ludwigii]